MTAHQAFPNLLGSTLGCQGAEGTPGTRQGPSPPTPIVARLELASPLQSAQCGTGVVVGKIWGKMPTLSRPGGNTEGTESSNPPGPFPCPRCSPHLCPLCRAWQGGLSQPHLSSCPPPAPQMLKPSLFPANSKESGLSPPLGHVVPGWAPVTVLSCSWDGGERLCSFGSSASFPSLSWGSLCSPMQVLSSSRCLLDLAGLLGMELLGSSHDKSLLRAVLLSIQNPSSTWCSCSCSPQHLQLPPVSPGPWSEQEFSPTPSPLCVHLCLPKFLVPLPPSQWTPRVPWVRLSCLSFGSHIPRFMFSPAKLLHLVHPPRMVLSEALAVDPMIVPSADFLVLDSSGTSLTPS